MRSPMRTIIIIILVAAAVVVAVHWSKSHGSIGIL